MSDYLLEILGAYLYRSWSIKIKKLVSFSHPFDLTGITFIRAGMASMSSMSMGSFSANIHDMELEVGSAFDPGVGPFLLVC